MDWTGTFDAEVPFHSIARRKNQRAADVLGTRPLNISFRRALVGDKLRLWPELVSKIANATLIEDKDYFQWSLTRTHFTVKSMYKDIMQAERLQVNCAIWKLKIPLIKIKIFMWYLKKGVLLTKDNLLKEKVEREQ